MRRSSSRSAWPGEHLVDRRASAERARDRLRPREAQVLDAVPVRRPAAADSIARTAGIGLVEVQRVLGRLHGLGLVERADTGGDSLQPPADRRAVRLSSSRAVAQDARLGAPPPGRRAAGGRDLRCWHDRDPATHGGGGRRPRRRMHGGRAARADGRGCWATTSGTCPPSATSRRTRCAPTSATSRHCSTTPPARPHRRRPTRPAHPAQLAGQAADHRAARAPRWPAGPPLPGSSPRWLARTGRAATDAGALLGSPKGQRRCPRCCARTRPGSCSRPRPALADDGSPVGHPRRGDPRAALRHRHPGRRAVRPRRGRRRLRPHTWSGCFGKGRKERTVPFGHPAARA